MKNTFDYFHGNSATIKQCLIHLEYLIRIFNVGIGNPFKETLIIQVLFLNKERFVKIASISHNNIKDGHVLHDEQNKAVHGNFTNLITS